MVKTKGKLSQTYSQLSQLFDSLEKANFEEGKDFGENICGCFKWFVSPPALAFIEKRSPEEWKVFKNNARFNCSQVPWEGYKTAGLDINLVL